MIRDNALSKRTLYSVSSNERPKVCPTKARMSPTDIVAPCSSQALCMAPWIRCHFFFSFFLAEFQPPLGPTPGQLPPHLDRVCCRIECNQCCGASRGTRRRLLSWRGRRAMMCAATFALSGPGARAYTSAPAEPAGSILLSVDDGRYQVLLPVRRANLNHASERPQPCNKHTQLQHLP